MRMHVLFLLAVCDAATVLPEYSNASCTPTSPLQTRLATAAHLDTANAAAIIRRLENANIRYHRKQWEFVYIVEALEHAAMLAPGKRALVFAAGNEPLISFFASRGVHVTATDMDATEASRKGWVHTNQHAASREKLFREHLITRREFEERVSYMTMDMNRLNTSMYGKYDFVWSTCSLEHVGSIALGKLFAIRSMLFLKPGGVAVHTTEFTLSSRTHTIETGPTVLWRRKDVEELRDDLRALGFDTHGICLSAGTTALDTIIDLPPFKSFRHMKLRLGEHVVTSVGWTARRRSE